MFLGQLDNPLGCRLCGVQLCGIDSIPAPLCPPPSVLYTFSLLISPLPWIPGERPWVGAWLGDVQSEEIRIEMWCCWWWWRE